MSVAMAAPDVPAPGDIQDAVVKVAGIAKSPREEAATSVDYSQSGRARWIVLQRRDDSCRAIAWGNRPATDGPRLEAREFQSVSPPTVAAALGLATVTTPDDAGWYLSLGRRSLVKPTSGLHDGATLAYESWISAGWLFGVAPEAPLAARVLWDAGKETPLELQKAFAQAIAAAPDTGAWVIAGRVVFNRSMGQGLHVSPSRQPRNARFAPQDATRSLLSPTESGRTSALIVACVASGDTPVGAEVLRRFLSEGDNLNTEDRSGAKWLAHFALLDEPALPIDLSQTLDAIWDEPLDSEQFPDPNTLRRALNGCELSQALLHVWAVQAIEPYRFPNGTDLVDVTTLDDTLIAAHQWSRPNPLMDRPLTTNGRILLRRRVAQALVKVHERLKENGLRLKLHDGYRPFSISQVLYRKYPNATYLARPEFGSRHNRAAAVDCSLTDAKGRDVEMPSPVLTFNTSSDRWRDSMSPEARRHLNLLTEAMTAEGFSTIKSEWWHYDGPDWESYPVLNVPIGDAARAASPAPEAPMATSTPENEEDRSLIPSELKPRSRNPFDRPSDTPLPEPEPRATYQREASAPPTATPPSLRPVATPSSASETNGPILPLPVLVGIWFAILAVLLLLLFLRPKVR